MFLITNAMFVYYFFLYIESYKRQKPSLRKIDIDYELIVCLQRRTQSETLDNSGYLSIHLANIQFHLEDLLFLGFRAKKLKTRKPHGEASISFCMLKLVFSETRTGH